MNVVARRSVGSGARFLARARLPASASSASASSPCQHAVSAAFPVLGDDSAQRGRAPAQFVAGNPHLFGARSMWTLANRPRVAAPVTQSLSAPSLQQQHPLQLQRAANPLAIGHQRRNFVGPFARIIAQFAATAAVVFGKAFMQAFAQAQANAKNPKAAAESMGIQKKSMDVGQAFEVLNLSPGASRTEVEEQFEKYFAANDPDNGGSFYLQSKVYQAKNAILADMADSSGGGGGAAGNGEEDPVYKEQELRKDL